MVAVPAAVCKSTQSSKPASQPASLAATKGQHISSLAYLRNVFVVDDVVAVAPAREAHKGEYATSIFTADPRPEHVSIPRGIYSL